MRVLHIKYLFLISLRFWQNILVLWQKNLYWLFQIKSFCKIIIGWASDDSSVKLESRIHWQSLIVSSSVVFCFLVVKSDLIYLSHAICPNLHGQLINWTSAFYLSFLLYGFTQNTEYISLWIGLFQLFVFLSYILCFFLCNFTSYGICIDFDNKQKFCEINLYFFVACVG